MVPTGELRLVHGTPFDFQSWKMVGKDIGVASDAQIAIGGGYDHNFVLSGEPFVSLSVQLTDNCKTIHLAADVEEPHSGRRMVVGTTEPGMQFYTGNFLDGRIQGAGGLSYGKRSGFCLETQHFPDALNNPHFPSILLGPGQEHRSITVYKFAVAPSTGVLL
jgi:aldose 1-epimerase